MQTRWMRAALLVAALAGCSSLKPYRADVRQGNYIDEVTVAEVKQGMTREQVRYLLGTPLLVDTFRPDRWDYVYEFRPGHQAPERRMVSIFFENDTVARIKREGGLGEVSEEMARLRAKNRVVEVPSKAEKE